MNRFQFSLLVAFNFLIVLPAFSALTVDTIEPTGAGVIASNPHSFSTTGTPGPFGERDTVTQTFSATGGYGARGQTFITPDIVAGNLWDVSAITVRADANAAGVGVSQNLSGTPANLRLWVFEWNPSNDGNLDTQWTSGDGITDGNPFNGTGINNILINGDLFDVTRSFSGEFLHFSTPGLQLSKNTAYGFLVNLESTANVSLRLDDVRDPSTATPPPAGQTYGNGGLLRSDAALNSLNSNGDDLVFYVEALAVPEPTTLALFGIGACLFAGATYRRQKRD